MVFGQNDQFPVTTQYAIIGVNLVNKTKIIWNGNSLSYEVKKLLSRVLGQYIAQSATVIMYLMWT